MQTNLFADQCHATCVPSPCNLWLAVSTEEMPTFLGMHTAMGIVSLPSLHEFWLTEPILQHQWFSSVMSQDYVKQILCYFHCCDSTGFIPWGEEGHDPLYKVRRVEILSRNFKDHFKSGCELSAYESMIGTKCRVPFLQYLPKKNHEMGDSGDETKQK